jgi:hypothetical protein
MIDDYTLFNDMKMDFSLSDNEEINAILDEFFSDETVSDRMKFLQSILSL